MSIKKYVYIYKSMFSFLSYKRQLLNRIKFVGVENIILGLKTIIYFLLTRCFFFFSACLYVYAKIIYFYFFYTKNSRIEGIKYK